MSSLESDQVRKLKAKVTTSFSDFVFLHPLLMLLNTLTARSLDDSDEDMPRKGGRGSRRTSTPGSTSSGKPSAEDEEEEEEEESDASDEFFANKKQKAKKRKATSSKSANGKKKLRRARENDSADTSDYASFAGKNAPRASTLSKSMNYAEDAAFDSFSSEEEEDEEEDDENADEDDSEVQAKASKKKKGKKSWKEVEQQGDAIEGVFDHRRNEDMGKLLQRDVMTSGNDRL